MDIKKIKNKIWLTRCFYFDQENVPDFAALLRPKINRCDIVQLCFSDVSVKFDDFNFFATSAKEINLVDAQILCNNENPVMLENILEALPNVEKFECYFENYASMVSASTVKNISNFKNLGNLKELILSNIPAVFELNELFAFIKDQRNTKFRLDFADNCSDEYKNHLDQIIDSIIETPHLKALIYFDGQNQEKRKILWERFCK